MQARPVRGVRRRTVLIVATFVVVTATPIVQSQIPGGAASGRATTAPRTAGLAATTPWGDPDLQGTWPSGAMSDVPFERPVEMGDRAELSDVEFLARRDAIRRFEEQDRSPVPVR